MRRPPRLAQALLGWVLPAEDREAALGDLQEELSVHVLASQGRLAAYGWYWRQTLGALTAALAEKAAKLVEERTPLMGGRRDGPMRNLFQDLRFGLRSLSRNPGFSLVVMLSLALGIGANVIVFSIVDGLVLHPFDYPEGDRLVGVGPIFPKRNQELSFWETLSPQEYLDLRNQSRTLESVVCWDMGNRQVSDEGSPENTFSAFWWGNAFETLGVTPELGRGFSEKETVEGAPVAIISYRFWKSRFGGDPGLVGKTIHVNGNPQTLIGVMPEGTLIYGTDLWLPFGVDPQRFPRNRRQMQVLARLSPEATLEEANLEMAAIARNVEQAYSNQFEEYQGWLLVAQTWTSINSGPLRPAGLLLMGAVGFVLLLVCANMASYYLARALRRQQEIAVRQALGAAARRLASQLFAESVILALLGGLLGAGLASVGIRWIAPLVANTPFVSGSIALNARVLIFSLLVSVGVGLLLGLVPAIRGARTSVQSALSREGHRSTQSGGKLRLQGVFVAVEVALAIVLLMAGGLLIRSFLAMRAVDMGFDTRGLLTMRLTLPHGKYQGEQIERFFNTLIENVRTLPGVESGAVASQFPPFVFGRGEFWIEGSSDDPEGRLPTTYYTQVSDDYQRTIGNRLVAGRYLGEEDRAEVPRVMVVNQTFADRYFPGRSPIGERIKPGKATSDSPVYEIVGVVSDIRNLGLQTPTQPEVFISIRQAGGNNNQLFLVIRSALAPQNLVASIKREVASLDPGQPIYAVQTVDAALVSQTARERVATAFLSIFGLFALALAAVGIFSVVSYKAAARTREIGLRIALGARVDQVRRLVTRQALMPVAIGGIVGLAAALVLGRFLSSLLFGVGGSDPITILVVVSLFLLVAFAASYVPAYRATRLDPVSALRCE